MANTFSLAEITDLMRATRSPVGFVVSQAIWDGLLRRASDDAAVPALTLPSKPYGGVALACDPKLPDTEFEAAFTDEAWQKRLASLKSNSELG